MVIEFPHLWRVHNRHNPDIEQISGQAIWARALSAGGHIPVRYPAPPSRITSDQIPRAPGAHLAVYLFGKLATFEALFSTMSGNALFDRRKSKYACYFCLSCQQIIPESFMSTYTTGKSQYSGPEQPCEMVVTGLLSRSCSQGWFRS